jgi:hypothetical protein
MYEIEYMLGAKRVASFRHPGPAKAARETAEDGIRRHHAEHACIVERKTMIVETWPPQESDERSVEDRDQVARATSGPALDPA